MRLVMQKKGRSALCTPTLLMSNISYVPLARQLNWLDIGAWGRCALFEPRRCIDQVVHDRDHGELRFPCVIKPLLTVGHWACGTTSVTRT